MRSGISDVMYSLFEQLSSINVSNVGRLRKIMCILRSQTEICRYIRYPGLYSVKISGHGTGSIF